jgi:flagellar basal-body rod protein FlgC
MSMDYARSFAVSAAGMSVERMRVEAAALNLANANTVHGPGAAAYQPVRVVAQGAPFSALVDAAGEQELPVAMLAPADVAARMVHEPGHPLANEQGFVTSPGVDAATEMVTLMSAMRSYEANVAAFNTARSLALRTLEIGKGT